MLRIEGQRDSDGWPGQRIGDFVAKMQGLDNLNGNRRNGSYHGFSFRHSNVCLRTVLTIDNYSLSIVLDGAAQISDSGPW